MKKVNLKIFYFLSEFVVEYEHIILPNDQILLIVDFFCHWIHWIQRKIISGKLKSSSVNEP